MIAILSDIHGNRLAIEGVFAEMAKLGVRRMVVLGDVVGYGRFPDDRAGHPYLGRTFALAGGRGVGKVGGSVQRYR